MKKAGRALTELYDRVFRNWKTTLGGVFLFGVTVMMVQEKITVNEYLGLLGAIGTITALFAKDNKEEV
jgi:hypothetical protein